METGFGLKCFWVVITIAMELEEISHSQDFCCSIKLLLNIHRPGYFSFTHLLSRLSKTNLFFLIETHEFTFFSFLLFCNGQFKCWILRSCIMIIGEKLVLVQNNWYLKKLVYTLFKVSASKNNYKYIWDHTTFIQ